MGLPDDAGIVGGSHAKGAVIVRITIIMVMKRGREYGQQEERQDKDRKPGPALPKAICSMTHHVIRKSKMKSLEL